MPLTAPVDSASAILDSSKPSPEAATASTSPNSSDKAPDALADALNATKADSTKDAASPGNEPSKEEPKSVQDDKIGSKFAALTRKERQVVAKQQELKAEEAKIAESKVKAESELTSERAKIAAERAELVEQRKEVTEFHSLKKLNPLEAMAKLGFTYDQITDAVLNDGKPSPERVLERKAKEMEDKFEAFRKEQAEKEAAIEKAKEERVLKAAEEEKAALSAEQDKLIKDFKTGISSHISSNVANYELINENYSTEQAEEIIYAVVVEHLARTSQEGKATVLNAKEASDLVEAYLEKQIERNLATNKFKAKVSPIAAPTASPSKEDESATSSKADAITPSPTETKKTITNDLTASSTKIEVLSEKDRMAKALAIMNGEKTL